MRRTRQYLLDAYQDGPAIVGGCGMHLEDYYRYADQAATDDQPLYLFGEWVYSLHPEDFHHTPNSRMCLRS